MRGQYSQVTRVSLSASGAGLAAQANRVLDGFAVLETGSAAGAWYMRHGDDATDQRYFPFSLSSGQSTSETGLNFPCPDGIYLEEISGTSTIDLCLYWHIVGGA